MNWFGKEIRHNQILGSNHLLYAEKIDFSSRFWLNCWIFQLAEGEPNSFHRKHLRMYYAIDNAKYGNDFKCIECIWRSKEFFFFLNCGWNVATHIFSIFDLTSKCSSKYELRTNFVHWVFIDIPNGIHFSRQQIWFVRSLTCELNFQSSAKYERIHSLIEKYYSFLLIFQQRCCNIFAQFCINHSWAVDRCCCKLLHGVG